MERIMKLKRINKCFLMIAATLLMFGLTEGLAQNHMHTEHGEHCEQSVQKTPAALSPAGVMGDHVHSRGSWMFSYMYMGMQMEGLLDGRSQLNAMSLTDEYEMLPNDMFMQMHMLGIMTAVSDRFTLMAMVPLVHKNMTHTHMGHHHHASAMSSSGLGDIRLSVLTPIWRDGSQRVILNSGVTLPTGSVKVSSVNGMGMDSRMGYGMQHGTGTTDLHGSVTYAASEGSWGYGTQLGGAVRLGNNNEGYRHGNSLEHSAWIGRTIIAPLTATVRVNSTWQDHIHGIDSNIAAGMMPTADPLCYGGLRTRLLGGLNLRMASLLPVNGSLGFEGGLPVYQDLNGPQMGESWMILTTLRISI
jgi:hypothetical protein